MRQILAGSLVTILFATQGQAQSSASDFTVGTRYDAIGRVVGVIQPDPDGTGPLHFAAIRNSYDISGRLVKVERGELTAWQSEGVAPSAWSGFAVVQQMEISYDSMHRKSKEVLSFKETGSSNSVIYSVTQYSYDLDGALICQAVRMNPDPAVFAAPPASACTMGTPGTGGNNFGPDRITRMQYDVTGHLLQIRRGVGTSLEQAYATYGYTANGQQQFVIDANGNKAKFEYDGFDRLEKWILPSLTRPTVYNPSNHAAAMSAAGLLSTQDSSPDDYEQYGYDAGSNRTSLRKRDGQTIGYAYDALNRLTVKDIPGGSAADAYYDYDLRGLQLSARFGSASGQGTLATYDSLGRLTSSSTTMGGVTRTLRYCRDASGNRTRLAFPDASTSNGDCSTSWSNSVSYTYDGLDRMIGIYDNGGVQITTVTYDNRGQRATMDGGGVSSAIGFDQAGHLASVAHNLAGDHADVTYCMGVLSTGCSTSYSPSNQITKRTISNDNYVWDRAKNVVRPYAANGLNQYTVAGPANFAYDLNGNLTSDGSTTYAYDVENHLVSATGASNATLSYDPSGRLFQTTGSVTTQFVYDGDELVAEYDGSGNIVRRYIHGTRVDDPLFWYEGSNFTSRRVLRADHQGSIVSVADANGNSLAINSYDEYGIPASTNLGRFAYTGQTYLPDLKFYHYKARIYSPTLGRFLQTDPVGYEDQVNLYAYVGNDPMSLIDPSGMSGCADMESQKLTGKCVDAPNYDPKKTKSDLTLVTSAQNDGAVKGKGPEYAVDNGEKGFRVDGDKLSKAGQPGESGNLATVKFGPNELDGADAFGHSHAENVNASEGSGKGASKGEGTDGVNPGPGDGKGVLAANMPLYITHQGTSVVIEVSGGQARVRVIEGSMNGTEERLTKSRLRDMQRLIK